MNQNLLRGASACFGVQKIIDVLLIDGNVKNYKVEWTPSWVDGSYLHGCETLLEEFLKQRSIQEGSLFEGNQRRSYEYLRTEVIEQVDTSNGVSRITSLVPVDEMSNNDSTNRISFCVSPDEMSNDDNTNRITTFSPGDIMSNDDSTNKILSLVPDKINEKDNPPATIFRNFDNALNAMKSSLSSEDSTLTNFLSRKDVTEYATNDINEKEKTVTNEDIIVVKEECLDDDGIQNEVQQINDSQQYETTNCFYNDSNNEIYQIIGSTDAQEEPLVGNNSNKHCATVDGDEHYVAMGDCGSYSNMDTRLECSFCEKVFSSNEDLVTHELSHIQTKSKIRSSKFAVDFVDKAETAKQQPTNEEYVKSMLVLPGPVITKRLLMNRGTPKNCRTISKKTFNECLQVLTEFGGGDIVELVTSKKGKQLVLFKNTFISLSNELKCMIKENTYVERFNIPLPQNMVNAALREAMKERGLEQMISSTGNNATLGIVSKLWQM